LLIELRRRGHTVTPILHLVYLVIPQFVQQLIFVNLIVFIARPHSQAMHSIKILSVCLFVCHTAAFLSKRPS